MIRQIYHIALRECAIIKSRPIYLCCLVVFPIFVTLFFTSLMTEGQPVDMPVGVVDQDNTATSRAMIRQLDAFQNTHVATHYPTVAEARKGIQRNEIYAFLLIPEGTGEGLQSSRQPKISFYYSSVTLLAGSTLFKDLKTVCTLGSARAGAAKLAALGKTEREIQAFLQPITIDLHMVGNPQSNYNVYLSTFLIPGVLMLFIFLLTPYSIGTEIKFGRSKEWMAMAGGNAGIALSGKLLPHTLLFLTIFYAYELYVYQILGFPHPGGILPILLTPLLSVAAGQGFGIFIFGLMPSLRMSMSISSLWSVISLSVCGATYPLFAMDSMIQSMAQLFPLRHYYIIYKTCIFGGYPLADCYANFAALAFFAALPLLVLHRYKRIMLLYVYTP